MSDPNTPSPDRSARRGADKAGFAIAFGLALLSLVVGWDAWRLSQINVYSAIGPAAFPTIIAGGLALLAVATAVEAIREGALERPRDEPVPMAWVLGGLIGQIILLPFLGFSIATGWLFAATAKGFGRGPVWAHFLAGTAMCLVIYLIFAKGLQLSLPAGPIERLF
ncbi:tripartite tricarboxylate transporter TctB family protein [Ancylobacter sp. MQZ15Z-1]|uniref:Tripartite tricarboxylate transporter TctB family protein n=1 Tax=Ancylobacter mangrovi TaxID=2972472 RepID=A0A9X2PDD4_9HYPH|nr:tripartite tricarboxylate transporter TctB family protein [Ancylobacter mangrovi]MCS0493920.1 tripartite tricarboxylate transporter TctB family protein [Ancylobacter mangrovi]